MDALKKKKNCNMLIPYLKNCSLFNIHKGFLIVQLTNHTSFIYHSFNRYIMNIPKKWDKRKILFLFSWLKVSKAGKQTLTSLSPLRFHAPVSFLHRSLQRQSHSLCTVFWLQGASLHMCAWGGCLEGRKEEKKKVANAHTFGVSEVCVGERAFPRTTLSWAGWLLGVS